MAGTTLVLSAKVLSCCCAGAIRSARGLCDLLVVFSASSVTVVAFPVGFFNKTFIKNGSHDTIHIFKNYFTTVFSVFSKISSIQAHPIFFFFFLGNIHCSFYIIVVIV